jgi:YidC/Oxa1 family membrane protein insertase
LDQRRFISFLLISVAVLMFFSVMFPPPQAPEQPQAAEQPEERPEAGAVQADPDVQPAEAGPRPRARPAELPKVAEAAVETQFLTIGSLDVASGYRMLATFTNRGAALHRAELASSRYRDQHDRSGYLGELELRAVRGGLRVQVVGAGTPAEAAGIQPGDLITGVGEETVRPMATLAEYNRLMADTRPGQQITLHIRRGDAEPQPRVVRLTWRPFAVLRPELENFLMRDSEPPADFVDRPSFLTTLTALQGESLDKEASKRLTTVLESGNWEVVEQGQSSLTFRRELSELGLEILKRYTIAAVPRESVDDINFPGYHVRLEVELRNTADEAQSLVYRIDGPTGMPVEGWWYAHKISRQRWLGGAGLRDVVVRFDGNQVHQIDCMQIASGDAQPMREGQALAYAGVDGQYFAAVMIPERVALQEVWFDTVEPIVSGPELGPRVDQRLTNVTCRLTRNTLELAAGATHRDAYQIFIGPKRPDLLAGYQAAGDPQHSLADIVYYGLALFGAVAKLMLWILHGFYNVVGNYGIAIIMLTVLVRGLMFPISYKQTKSMARMQALKPEMDRITEKYKNDLQKRSQATQELYRKHQINPLGGCLPVFLQLPIFIGLYRALMVDVELRQSPLLNDAIRWCSNLAAPDMLLDWSAVMPAFVEGFLGPYLNILPLVTVLLFLVTQKMAMPAPTNEQAAMQQKMMKYMTIFIGFLFYKVAAGLCLYFIASSLWGIGERKLLPKAVTAPSPGASGPEAITGSKRPSGGGPKPGPNGSPAPKRKSKKVRRKK